MHRANPSKALGLLLLVYGAFFACAALGMLINPEAFEKFFSSSQIIRDIPPQLPHRSYYWDVEHYATLAIKSQCSAFYPLWPLLIRTFFHPQTIEQAAHFFSVVSTALWLVSVPLLFWVFNRALNQSRLSFLLILAYTLSPIAIFRVIGYTESLFSLLSLLLIGLCLTNNKLHELVRLAGLFIVIILMSLTRPILLQILFTAGASLSTVLLLAQLKLQEFSFRSFLTELQNKYLTEIRTTITISFAAISGYCLYGFYCLRSRGDFFWPFTEQKNWGKSLGLHLELLFLPKSPLFDLLGLYLPLLVLFLSLFLISCKIKAREPLVFIPQSPLWTLLIFYPPLLLLLYCIYAWRAQRQPANHPIHLRQLKISDYALPLGENYLFWFCVYFPVAHSLIVFLTQDRLLSLARYIFATPFLFVAIGYLCCCIPSKKTYPSLLWFTLISAIALVQQWVSYGYDEWLG